MTNQEILDNAPEGATHYDCDEYMRHVHDGEWEYWSKAAGWEETTPQSDTRSLADIKRIVELEKVELETVAKARKMFVVNARKFGYFDSVGHTIQELQSWEKALTEQGE